MDQASFLLIQKPLCPDPAQLRGVGNGLKPFPTENFAWMSGRLLLNQPSRLECGVESSFLLLFLPVPDTLLDIFHPVIHLGLFISLGGHAFFVICYNRLNSLYPFRSLGIGKTDDLSAPALEQVHSLDI